MNRKYMISGVLAWCAGIAAAQTLSQAKAWFEAGEFEKARPVFRKLVRQAPSNASYNFWYGACCYEGKDLEEARPYLEKSAARKVINAYLYLGRLYYDMYRFDEAVENVEEHIHWLERKNRDTGEAEDFLTGCRKAARLFRVTEKVVVTDSFVVDKTDFLAAYELGREAGKLESSAGDGTHIRFVNELENKRIFAADGGEGETRLFSQFRLIDQWGGAEPMKGIEGTNPDYPFLASDGVTLYYAAQGEESLGGYDIFVTRFNSDTNSYLRPDNLGMPFNSPFNDYMYVVDEYHNLGWFASDRYQPEGKVCVYVFVPNRSKEVYDYESTDSQDLMAAAALKSIRSTWKDERILKEAKQRLAALADASGSEKDSRDFTFVVDDHTVYGTLGEFRSEQARSLYAEQIQRTRDFEVLEKTLGERRRDYEAAGEVQREKLAPAILDMEKRVEEMRNEIAAEEIRIRNMEIRSRTE